jgi:serine protease inhibitor
MNKKTITFIILLILSLLIISTTGCHTETNNNNDNGNQNQNDDGLSEDDNSTDITSITDSNRIFSAKIFKKITLDEVDKGVIANNIFFSPLSISIALSMTYNGANGDTMEAMASTLSFGDLDMDTVNNAYQSLMNALQDKGEGVELAIANALFGKEGISFKDDFIQTIKKYYDGDFQALDFSNPDSVKIINDWVKKQTREKIKKILTEIPPEAILYLINAIYFKGKWTISFDKEETRERDFTLQNGEKKQVNMMWSSGKYIYKKHNNYKAVSLPYGDDEDVSMYIFVPNEGLGIVEFLDLFDKGSLEAAVKDFQPANLDYLGIPRFKIKYQKGLVNILSDMGMEVAFSSSADFSSIADIPDLAITNVIHKAYVEVNEEGTEAAAVTAVEVGITSEEQPIGLLAERPFLFLIRDNTTETILFMGVVIEPEE